MTKREILTRILEEGKRVFENGGSFTVNSVVLANFYKTCELGFDYEEDTGIIKMVYVLCEGHVVLCIGTDYIVKINVSDNWIMIPGIGNTVYGRVNGKRFICK